MTSKTLLDLAWEVPDDLINGEYINANGYKCAVGWMLEEAGLSDKEIDDKIGVFVNDEREHEWLIIEAAIAYGITPDQVEEIIWANDNIDDYYDDEGKLEADSLRERQLAIRRKLLELAGAGVDV